MPKNVVRTEDVVWERTEIVNTPSGAAHVVWYITQVTEVADGRVIEQRPRERRIIRPGEHITDQERAELERIARKEFAGVRRDVVGD